MSKRWQNLGIAVLAVVTAAAVIGAVRASSVDNPTPAERAAAQSQVSAVAAGTPSPSALSPLRLAGRMLTFGDSWTAGTAAHPETKGFAYLVPAELGMTGTVLGVGTTGYLNPGSDPKAHRTYEARLLALKPLPPQPNVIVLQGSQNDVGEDLAQLRGAVDQVLATLRSDFPTAQIVVLGPDAPTLPYSDNYVSVDNILRERAAAAGLHYISPLGEQWITSQNIGQVIDPNGGSPHPSTAGHAYIAQRLVADLKALA